MSRESLIIVSATNNHPERINDFTGDTWGELKAHPSVSCMLSPNVEAIMKPGNVTLNRDEAVIPNSGRVTIYLIPTKNKAGSEGSFEKDANEIISEIEDAVDNAIEENSDVIFEITKKNIIDTLHVALSNILNGLVTPKNPCDCNDEASAKQQDPELLSALEGLAEFMNK